ncbi:MAG: tRNA uridine-5-carboxymethylaminomethyl(34) synthesis GTPase MnmE [Defluviitaleaceae bacterium]|nr:tRNA uridine-5-carboxymethylaminomethyl(34) synthesis GTPase MnmE [Defluviitaleaceae bacterium]
MYKLAKFNIDDTIVGISSPTGGSIAIVRISGSDAIPILSKIFSHKGEYESHRIYYGWIFENAQKIDEVLVSVMLAPRTFTRQDVVEINCHGGTVAVQKILALVLVNGARLAEAGEFTKRAFLAGRIDLSQAEAVMDIIGAKSELSHKSALSQLSGNLSILMDNCANDLLNALARIEMAIDYPDHEEAEIVASDVRDVLCSILKQVDKLLATASGGKLIREGIKTAIIGQPNVGKSSLLNAMLGQERAIVTHIAGTTRDVLRETIQLGDIFLIIADTAGIRETDDIVEKEGVVRSAKEAEEADLVLLVLDGSQPLDEDFVVQQSFKNLIVVINKSDLPQQALVDGIDAPMVRISAQNGDGIDELTAKIKEVFAINNLQYSQEIVTNVRHINLLNAAKEYLNAAVSAINTGMFIDLVAIDIQDAYAAIGEITGVVVDEELIDRIFSEFCLGK